MDDIASMDFRDPKFKETIKEWYEINKDDIDWYTDTQDRIALNKARKELQNAVTGNTNTKNT